MFKGDYESKDCPALSNTLTGSGREFSFGHFEDIRRPPRCRKFINADPYLIILFASMLLSCTLQAEKLKLWVLLLNEWWVSVKYAKLKKRVEDKTYVIQNPQCAPCSIYHDSTSTAPSTCPMLYLSQLNLHSTCRSRGAQAHACILLCGLQFCASAPPPIPSQILKAEWFTHNNWKTIQSNRNVGTKDCSKGRVRTVHRVDWIFSTMVEWKPLFCQLTQSTVHPPHHRPAPVKTDQVRPHNTGNRDSIQKDFGKHADFTKRVETRNRRSVMRTDDRPTPQKNNKQKHCSFYFIHLSFFSIFFLFLFHFHTRSFIVSL